MTSQVLTPRTFIDKVVASRLGQTSAHTNTSYERITIVEWIHTYLQGINSPSRIDQVPVEDELIALVKRFVAEYEDNAMIKRLKLSNDSSHVDQAFYHSFNACVLVEVMRRTRARASIIPPAVPPRPTAAQLIDGGHSESTYSTTADLSAPSE